MKTDVFSMPEGPITIQYPDRLSLESYEDFKAWLDLLSRKAKRAADKRS